MQAKISTQKNSFRNSINFSKVSILSLLMVCFLFMGQQANAQLILLENDLNFAPSTNGETSPTGTPYLQNNTSTSSNSFDLSQNLEIQYSPVPIQNQALITKTPGVVLQSLKIMDIQGNIRFSGQFSNGSIYVPYLENGTYNFIVTTNQGTSTKLVPVSQ